MEEAHPITYFCIYSTISPSRKNGNHIMPRRFRLYARVDPEQNNGNGGYEIHFKTKEYRHLVEKTRKISKRLGRTPDVIFAEHKLPDVCQKRLPAHEQVESVSLTSLVNSLRKSLDSCHL